MTARTAFIFCAGFHGTIARQPYGPDKAGMTVRKTKGTCILSGHEGKPQLIIPCEPLEAELLRATYRAVRPGYHFNKRRWNSIYVDGTVPDAEIIRQIRNSYHLAIGKRQ